MKTLDEVIKAFEWCCNDDNDDCNECPYDGEDDGCHQRNLNALHYLRTYRANQQAYEESSRKAEEARERYLEAVKNCERAENIYKQQQKAAEDALWIFKEDKDELTALRAYWKEMHEDVRQKAEENDEDVR